MDFSESDLKLVRSIRIPVMVDTETKLCVVGERALTFDKSNFIFRSCKNMMYPGYNRKAISDVFERVSKDTICIAKRCQVKLADQWANQNTAIFNIQPICRRLYTEIYHELLSKLPMWISTLEVCQRQYPDVQFQVAKNGMMDALNILRKI